MNIRFDNEVYNQNEAKMNCKPQAIDNNTVVTTGQMVAADYAKSDNNYANEYQDKSSSLAGVNGIDGSKSQKDYMVLMSNTVSDEDYKALAENGFKPGEMTPEETVTVVDKIKAEVARSGKVVAGYNDNLDKDKLKEITGSEVYAGELAAAFSKYNLPVSNANISDAKAAMDMAMEVSSISEGAMKYMVENRLEPTIENIYLASHNGVNSEGSGSGYFMDVNGYLGKKSDVIQDLSIENQVKSIIENAGFEANEEKIKDAFTMIDSGMAVTAESFERYEQLKSLELPLTKEALADKIAMNIKDGRKAKDTNLIADKPVLERAADFVNEVNNISDEAVQKVYSEGKALNIKNLSLAQRSITASMSITAVSITAGSASFRASLTEVRISMTISSTAVLMRNGIDVYNEDLNMLSQELKEAGNRQFESLFGEEFSVDKGALKELFEEATDKINEIKAMPLGAVGLVSSRNAFSLNVLYAEGKTLQNQYISANEKYEPLMTEVRKDLGDSIKKAFANVSDILTELNLDINDDNERAVRILGYSNQEITPESIDKIRDVYEKVHNVIAKMTPGKTLELIRDGVNPLEISLDELEEKIDMNPLDPVKEAERYSHFLYRMEKSGQITEDEKESFIGIYRMINQIEKNDSAAIGTLIAQNGEINFKNLVSAVRTRNSKGIDAKINDEFGSLDKLNFKDKTITEQIEKAFEGRDIERNIFDDIEMNYIRENAEIIREDGSIKEDVLNLLAENGIKATTDNLQSAKSINENRGTTYKNIRKLSEKSTQSSQNVDKNVEKAATEAENVDKTPDFTERALDDLLNSFENNESAQTAYTSFLDKCDLLLNSESLKAGSYIDVKDIVSTMKQMSVIRSMSNNECYELPAYIDGELSAVRVKVMHEENQIANVNISLDTESYGRVGASFAFVASQLEGMILCDNDEGLNKIKNNDEEFVRNLSSEINVSRISYFKSSATNVNYYQGKTDILTSKEVNASNGLEAKMGKDAISTKALYKVAKEFIKILA